MTMLDKIKRAYVFIQTTPDIIDGWLEMNLKPDSIKRSESSEILTYTITKNDETLICDFKRVGDSQYYTIVR